jgi:hypothetical protein
LIDRAIESPNWIFDANLTPEMVRDRWSEICGPSGIDGMLGEGMFEMPNQARDNLAFRKVLGD